MGFFSVLSQHKITPDVKTFSQMLGLVGNSEEDEDDLGSSTPSAEHSDKNIQSMLCVRSVFTAIIQFLEFRAYRGD